MKQLTGLEIRRRRKLMGLTQPEMAKLLGISLRTLASYETGGPIPKSKINFLHRALYPELYEEETPTLDPGAIINQAFIHLQKQIDQLKQEIKELKKSL